MRVSLAWGILALLPAVAIAQPEAFLTFHPSAGTRLQFVSETRLSTVVVGFPSLPDSTVIESS